MRRERSALPPQKELQAQITSAWTSASMGEMMFRSTQLRIAVMALFAAVAISLATTSARAFSQDNSGAGGDDNSGFADPDEQVNLFGYGAGTQPFGSNGPVQFDAQQGRLNAFKHFQDNGLTSPPDPLTRPGN
jgi:hypothetical protein